MATREGSVPGTHQNSPDSSQSSEMFQMGEDGQEQESEGQQDQSPTGENERPAPTVFRAGGREFNSAEEMAEYISTLTSTVREQGRALNDLASRSEGVQPQGQPSVAQGGQPAQPASDPNADFWNDPVGVLRSEMQKMIAPFQQDLVATKAATATEKLRQEFQKFTDYEPMVDALIARTQQPRTYENLRAAYLMIRGHMLETGQDVPSTAAAPAQEAQQPQAGPPQHRPSAAPTPPPQGSGSKRRKLTEVEKRIAREGGYTDEQYLALLDLEEDEVVTSKIGRE